jgi:formylglycine-generating enzyme required for sulfatase activity
MAPNFQRLDLAKGDGGQPEVSMDFVIVPRGSFLMGDADGDSGEQPLHEVIIDQAFCMARTPVTRRQYQALVGSLPDNQEVSDGPVTNVSWHDAMKFLPLVQRTIDENPAWAAKVLRAMGLDTLTFRLLAALPSEAQWEYACRWRSGPQGVCTPQSCARTDYYSGDGQAALAALGWKPGASWESPPDLRAACPHPLGLAGLHGFVWQWCADVFDSEAYRKRVSPWRARTWDSHDAGNDASHVLRGGSWLLPAERARAAFRYRNWPVIRYWSIGFRLVLVPGTAGGASQAGGSGATDRRDQPTAGREPERSGGGSPAGGGSGLTHPEPPTEHDP